MKTAEQQIEKRSLDALKACLAGASFASVNALAQKTSGDGDLLVKVKTSAGSKYLIVKWKSSGQPRIVREAALMLARACQRRPSAYGVIVAPYISPKAAEICIEEGVGYVDFAGNRHLSFKGVYIEQSGKPNPSVVRREQRSLFSQKAARVLHVLFENPKKKWRIANLAKEAGVSLGQAFNVKKRLLDREIIVVDGDGIALKDPATLLGEWAVAYVSRKNWSEYFTLKSPAEFEAELAKLCAGKDIPYALMGFSAASRYAPAVRSNRAMAYVSGNVDKIAQELGLKAVTSGANVVLAFPSDEGVYYGLQEIDDMKIVSPLQAYLDLVGFRGRGDEAAQTILERKVRPTW